jgi:hypothetical protein
MFRGGRLATEFCLRFENAARVSAAGGILEFDGFAWQAYRGAMTEAIAAAGSPAWWSFEEELLSATHHLGAAEALERRYRRLADGTGNRQRIPGASTLARAAARWQDQHGRQALRSYLAGPLPDGATCAVVPPTFVPADAFLSDALAGLSALALACRLEPRVPGTYDGFLSELAGIGGDRQRALDSLHFLAAVGRESLALYLLLWETILATRDPCKT